jgi:hypothetical protein
VYERGVLCPVDCVSGGTWLGVNDSSLVVGVVNRTATLRAVLPPEISRGLIVRRLLEESHDAIEARRNLTGILLERRSAPGTIFMCDIENSCAIDLSAGTASKFTKPLAVLTERGLDERSARAQFAHKRAASLSRAGVEAMQEVLREHQSTNHRWYRTCCHGDVFGTVSSQIISLKAGRKPRLWHAEGHPCETEYQLFEAR